MRLKLQGKNMDCVRDIWRGIGFVPVALHHASEQGPHYRGWAVSWKGWCRFNIKCFRHRSTSSHSSRTLICTPDSARATCAPCYRPKCYATDTSSHTGCSRSKGLICTCDGVPATVCLGLSQPLPKDHLALSMFDTQVVQLTLSFVSSSIIKSPQPTLLDFNQ